MLKKTLISLTTCLLLLSTTAFAASPKVLFYVPFDGSVNATIAGGNPQGAFGKEQTPQFQNGISGKALVSGASNQHVVFDAAGNIPSDQWTITFWMKGLPGAQWNSGKDLQTFWELNGSDGFMWFYKYSNPDRQPWLLSRHGKEDNAIFVVPKAPEEQWHYWAMSWRKGTGAFVYLDGQLVGQSPCEPPEHIKNISIGQRENPSVQNKLIDEFKIYDGALDAGSIALHYWQEGQLALNPELTVVPTKQEVIIDGIINPQEWQGAAGFSGMLNPQNWKIESPRTWGRMTYDDANLYMALHSGNPREIKDHPDTTAQYGLTKKTAITHDGNVADDDHFFVQISRDGKLYSLLANSINTTYDAVSNANEQADTSWESGARVKSVVNADGWSLEAAIPLRSLGITKINESTWKMNVGRVWKMLRQRTDAWAVGTRQDDETAPHPLGTVHFVTSPDAVAQLNHFDIKPDGHVAAEVNLTNPGKTAHTITVQLSAAAKVLSEQQLSLNPGEIKTVQLDGLPQKADGALVEISVLSGAKVLLRQSAPLILERVGEVALWSYPSLQEIRLGWVVQSNADPNALRLDIQIKDKTGKTIQQSALQHIGSLNGSTMIDIKSLPPKSYIVEAQIKNGENVVQQQAIAFDKKPLPAWLGNTLGISDTPPPPWTDVQVNKTADALSIWGRTYTYANHLLPTQIINQGKPMLAAPMAFNIKTGNVSQSSDSAKANSQWTKLTPMRADSQRSQVINNVKLTSNSYTEFDGMTWMKLTVAPQTPKVLLDGLTFEIPLKAQWAKLIKPSDDYTMHQTGALPADGWKGKASSMPWIGNGDGGIQFFQESTATWIGSKSVEIVPDGKGNYVLRVHLIDAPTMIDKPLHFAFGWIVSPVKSAPQKMGDWRLLSNFRITQSYIEQAPKTNPNIKWYLPWWQGWWWLPDKDYKGNYDRTGPVPVPAGNKRMDAVHDYFGQTFYGAPYGRLSSMGTANPWFAQFGDEWVPNTSKFVQDTTVSPSLRATLVSQASSSLRDFYAWGYNRLLDEGDVHALYFDVSRPLEDSNIYHGAGTKMPDGSIAPYTSILGTREMFKRIYTMMKAKHPDGKIFYHMSGQILLPIDSFTDALIDGENYAGKLDRKDNRGYEKILSVDQFRTEYSAQNNFGPASVFLPEFERAKSIKPDEWKTLGYQHADYLMGLIFLHDSNLWWTWMPPDHVAQVYSAFDATGWNASWTFIPYWHQKYFSLPEGVYASLYQSPDDKKVLLVIMNTSGKDQDLNLPMTLGKSTFAKGNSVYPNQKWLDQDEKFSVKVTNNNFAAVLLTQ